MHLSMFYIILKLSPSPTNMEPDQSFAEHLFPCLVRCIVFLLLSY